MQVNCRRFGRLFVSYPTSPHFVMAGLDQDEPIERTKRGNSIVQPIMTESPPRHNHT